MKDAKHDRQMAWIRESLSPSPRPWVKGRAIQLRGNSFQRAGASTGKVHFRFPQMILFN